MEFNDVIKRRRSTRKFTDEPVSQQALNEIIAAANSAPVGSARYDHIELSVIKNKGVMTELSKATLKFIQDKKRMKAITGRDTIPVPAGTYDPFHGAPVVIIVSHKGHDVQPGIEYTNVGCVCENMHLAATNIGLGSFYVWGVLEAMRLYPELDTTSILGLPEDYMPVMGLVIGHPAAPLEEREIKDRLSVKYFE